MAPIDPNLSAAPIASIADAHQSTVAAILRAVELGLFTAAQAELMIDRVRAHLTALPVASPITLPSSAADGVPDTNSGLVPDVLPQSSNRTFS